MSLGDLFWFFFIFMAVQPMIRQRWLEARWLRIARVPGARPEVLPPLDKRGKLVSVYKVELNADGTHVTKEARWQAHWTRASSRDW